MAKSALKKWAAALLAVVLVLSLFSSCSGGSVQAVMDVEKLPLNLDPQTGSDSNARPFFLNILEGLTRKTSEGEIVLAAAKSYEVSGDGLTWRFELRPSGWSDGVAVTPDDFVFAIQRLFMAESGTKEVAKKFSALKNASAVLAGKKPVGNIGVWAEGNEVVFSLEKEEPALLELLALTAALPCRRDFFEETKGSYGLSRQNMVCNGPYAIQYWLAGEYIILRRNGSYTGSVGSCNRVLFYQTDSADWADRFAEEETNIFFSEQTVLDGKIGSQKIESCVYCLVLNKKDGVLQNKNLRTAITSSFDPAVIPDENAQGYRPVTNILPAAVVDAPEESPLTPDLAKAKKAMADYLLENNLEKAGALSILIPDEGNHREMLTHLQQTWQKELQLFVNLEIVSKEEWESRLQTGEYQLALMPCSAESEKTLDYLSKFDKKGVLNSFGFSDNSFTNALKAAKKDAAAADARLKKAAKLLKESGLILPLYSEALLCLYDKALEGMEIYPFGKEIYFASAGLQEKK